MDDYYKKLKVEMHSFIDSELYKIALNILPKREKHFFSSEDLLDSIFIIEKFLYGNIYPQKWSISFSSKFEKPNEDNTKKRFRQIEKFIKEGDIRINSRSYNFLPRSSREYLRAERDGDKRRYKVDFSNSFFGIKHMHLSQKHNDELLFYVNDHDTIYFLSIGNHKDMYRKNNVEIIVNEYPHLLPILKIFPLPVLMSRSSNYSVEQIKVLWESGNNILLQINDQSYMGMPQTFSNISNQNIITSQNHIYQLESQLEAILTSLKQDSNKVNLRLLYAKSRLSIKQGVIHFKDRVSGKEFQVASDFLLLLNTINIILGIKNVSN